MNRMSFNMFLFKIGKILDEKRMIYYTGIVLDFELLRIGLFFLYTPKHYIIELYTPKP